MDAVKQGCLLANDGQLSLCVIERPQSVVDGSRTLDREKPIDIPLVVL
jgi:hypothetical protein